MIQINHLIKEFDAGVRVVDDISLHVHAGEVFGFLGPNGAGKTTTIKILTTLLRPTSGTVKVAGHDVSEDPLAVRMSFGYIGQQSGVDPALTVSENLLLQARLYHLPKKKIKERMETLLALFEMSGRGGQWVGSLSGGLKRRLDIATALIHEPKLLFLDEPTIGLDPKSRSDLWAYLRRLNQEEGMTLFLTTHYLDEVDQLADRVGILDGGRIQVIGTPDELKDSLGHDAIHLTFEKPVQQEMLNIFRKKEWFKEVIQQGEAVRLYLENGQALFPKVIQWLDAQNLSAKSVLLSRPTFDDVYLKYTGKNWLMADQALDDEWGGSKNNPWAKKWQKKGAGVASDGSSDWKSDAEAGGGQDWKKWAGQTDSNWTESQKALTDTPRTGSSPSQEWRETQGPSASEMPASAQSKDGEAEWRKWERPSNPDGSENGKKETQKKWLKQSDPGEWSTDEPSESDKNEATDL